MALQAIGQGFESPYLHALRAVGPYSGIPAWFLVYIDRRKSVVLNRSRVFGAWLKAVKLLIFDRVGKGKKATDGQPAVVEVNDRQVPCSVTRESLERGLSARGDGAQRPDRGRCRAAGAWRGICGEAKDV